MQKTDPVNDGLVFVLGGARSGKSRYAERLIESSGLQLVYLATATAGDGEMSRRIIEHRTRRSDSWRTIEEPLDIARVIETNATAQTAILVDCLTLWLTNLMTAERDIEEATKALLNALAASSGLIVMVSNEVGLGIVPIDPMARAFTDHAGRLHQKLAAAAEHVTLITAGLPLHLKGPA